MLVHGVDTMFMFCKFHFCELVNLKITFSGLARDCCHFPSRGMICFSTSMFAFIPLFVDFVHYLTF